MGRAPKEIVIKALNSKERGYLVGLFVGDGAFCIDKKSRHSKVSFSLNPKRDQDIQKLLIDLLKKIGLNPFVVFNNGSSDTRVNSIKLVEFIQKELNEVDQNFENQQYFVGFLSGLIDSDGYVRRGNIVVSMKDPSILRKVRCVAEKLFISTRLWNGVQVYPPGSEIWYLRISTKFKNTSHLSQKIRRSYGSGGKLPAVASA